MQIGSKKNAVCHHDNPKKRSIFLEAFSETESSKVFLFSSFNRNTLCKVSWLVDIPLECIRSMVGKELQNNRSREKPGN